MLMFSLSSMPRCFELLLTFSSSWITRWRSTFTACSARTFAIRSCERSNGPGSVLRRTWRNAMAMKWVHNIKLCARFQTICWDLLTHVADLFSLHFRFDWRPPKLSLVKKQSLPFHSFSNNTAHPALLQAMDDPAPFDVLYCRPTAIHTMTQP